MRALPALMIVSDERPALLARLERALAQAEPGRVAVQLRERSLPSGELLALARSLRALTRATHTLLLINDRVDIALAVAADGVHLPERGLVPAVARALLGPEPIVGCSRHDRAGLAAAAREGADYATLSPVHAVPGKAPPLGLAGFAQAIAGLSLPVYALGGVGIGDVGALHGAGAQGVAVMREVLSAEEPGARVRALLAALPHQLG